MRKKTSTTRTDPELVRQLKAAAADERSVEAVFRLHPDDPSDVAPSPERTEELTHEVLQRVKDRTGGCEERLNVFRHMGAFAVSADPAFIAELLSEPEIAAAVANQQPDYQVEVPVKKPPPGTKSKTRAKKQSSEVVPKRTKKERG